MNYTTPLLEHHTTNTCKTNSSGHAIHLCPSHGSSHKMCCTNWHTPNEKLSSNSFTNVSPTTLQYVTSASIAHVCPSWQENPGTIHHFLACPILANKPYGKTCSNNFSNIPIWHQCSIPQY